MTKNIRLSGNEKLILISNIQTMLQAGIPILEVVDSMLEDARGNQKVILVALKEDLNQGKAIYSSFERFPQAFDPITINLIKAAEEAGTLDETLKDLVENITKDIEFSGKIKAALVYPILVVVIFFSVLILILTFVIPRVADVFSRLKIQLPLPTKILIAASNLVTSYTILIIFACALFAFGVFVLWRTQRQKFLNVVFSLPLLSRLAREIDLTRFSRSMSLLLSSGIPITDSLELSKNVVNKKELQLTIANSLTLVSSGKKLSVGLKKSKEKIPSIVTRITEAGEKSGTLEKSMQDLANYFDSQVANTLKGVTTLFEPILLVVVGLMVGGVMLAIIAPIYGLISQIGGR
ncbi:MAG: type II secretion system F family protein [Candidatus Blackburnbacteria bacterium]|nr:type II secretion system F family protein [Candidatus Blackburnbacteria bacterium]